MVHDLKKKIKTKNETPKNKNKNQEFRSLKNALLKVGLILSNWIWRRRF